MREPVFYELFATLLTVQLSTGDVNRLLESRGS
jgi:hypothetical protein